VPLLWPVVDLGVVVSTPGAAGALDEAGIAELLARHQGGDWGCVAAADRAANARALRTGARLFSAYDTPAGPVWVVTERTPRSRTTVLLPGEY